MITGSDFGGQLNFFLLLLLGIKWVGRKLLFVLIFGIYVVLNVIAPSVLVWYFLPDEWGWGIALILLAKILEFGGFKIGSIYLTLLQETPRASPKTTG